MQKKTAVVYHYFERDETYRDNLIFFLATALSDAADYFLVISGDCSVTLPERANLRTLRMGNWNNDFGGYVTFVRESFPNDYARFIFVNSSVRGPFLPAYGSRDWIEIFTAPLQGDVHLVGASVNILPETVPLSVRFAEIYDDRPPHAHVQTTAYALTRAAMDHLMAIGFYDIDETLPKDDVILHYELRLSREILRNGWNMSSILPVYGDLDYRSLACDFENFSSKAGDVLYAGAFFGRTLSPVEAMFVKVNRNMIPPRDLASYTFTSLSGRDLAAPGEGRDLLDRSYRRAKELTEAEPQEGARRSRLGRLVRKMFPAGRRPAS